MTDSIHRDLDDALAAVGELDARCCDPGRSPRMATLADQIAAVRRAVDGGAALPEQLAAVEAAGATVGALQVGCCAPNRLPLYTRILDRLTAVQLQLTSH